MVAITGWRRLNHSWILMENDPYFEELVKNANRLFYFDEGS